MNRVQPLHETTTPINLEVIEFVIPCLRIRMFDLRPNGPYLVQQSPVIQHDWEREEDALSGLAYRAGQQIPTSGIYLVEHFRHREGHEVTLIRGERFPFCQKCGFGVIFTLLQAAPELENSTSPKIVLHQIPDVSETDPEAA